MAPRRSPRNVSPESHGTLNDQPDQALIDDELAARQRKRQRDEDHEDAIRQLELQERRVRQEHEQELHHERLRLLREQQTQITAQDDGTVDRDAAKEGEIAPEAKEVSALFPSLPQTQIVLIYNNEFDPINLFKLQRKTGFSSTQEKADDVIIANGKFRIKKKTGSAKEYKLPKH